MYFNGLIFALLMSLTLSSNAREIKVNPVLSLQPNKCVALHKGRQCFAKINIKWHVLEQGDFCLHQTTEPQKELACWSNKKQAKLEYEFASQSNTEFVLKERSSGKVIARSEINVSWLYNSSNKRRRWRLF